MAERYTGWHGKAGDANASPAARNLAKQMLGELTNQNRLSGVPLLKLQKTATDGTTVTATLSHGIPGVRFSRTDQTPSDVLSEMIQGFATAPRTFAAFNAYDTNPHIIIGAGAPEGPPARGVWFYERAAGKKPYKINNRGQELYFIGGVDPSVAPTDPGEGIGKFGYVDWRDQSQAVTINYGGAPNRYFAINGAWLDQYIYHNGEILLDSTALTGFGGVAGACIRDGHIIWCIVEIVGGFGGSLVYKLYRAKIKRFKRPPWVRNINSLPLMHGPRFAKITNPAEVTLLQTVTIPDAGFQFYGSNVFFNQSGTEMKGLYYNTNATTLFVRELTIIFADLANIQVADVQLSAYSETDAVTINYPVCGPNLFKAPFAVASDGSFDHEFAVYSNTLPIGSYTVDAGWPRYYLELAFTLTPVRSTFSSGFDDPFLLVKNATYTRTITPSIGNIVAAVDYQNDVPVYAYHRARSSTTTCTYTAGYETTADFDAYQTYDVIGPSPHLDTGSVVDQITASRHQESASASTYTKTGVGVGLWIPKTRPEDTPGNWLDAQPSYSDTGSSSAAASSDYAANHLANTTSDAATFTKTLASTNTVRANMSVWFCDLRYDAITFSVFYDKNAASEVGSYGGSFSGATPNGINNPYAGWGPGDTSNQYLSQLTGSLAYSTTPTRTCTTAVIFDREQVASCAGYRPMTATSGTITTPLTDYDRVMWGYRALGVCVLEAAMFDANGGGLFAAVGSPDLYIYEGITDPIPTKAESTSQYTADTTFDDADARVSFWVTSATLYGIYRGSYGIDPNTAEDAATTRTTTDTDAGDSSDYSVYGSDGVSFVMCPSSWAVQANLATNDYELVPGGAWIAYKGDWAFSMAWLNGDTTGVQWSHLIRNEMLVPGGKSLNNLSQRTAESYAPMWPFAKSIYSYVKK